MVDVLAVGTGVGESLEAFGAAERFLSRVQADVLGEVVLVLELLVAPVAEPGSFICKKMEEKTNIKLMQKK